MEQSVCDDLRVWFRVWSGMCVEECMRMYEYGVKYVIVQWSVCEDVRVWSGVCVRMYEYGVAQMRRDEAEF